MERAIGIFVQSSSSPEPDSEPEPEPDPEPEPPSSPDTSGLLSISSSLGNC